MMKFLVGGVILFAIIAGVLFWRFGARFGGGEQAPKEVFLNIYGLWEEESLIKPAIDEYKKLHPDVTINYKFQTSQNYKSRIQTQVTEGEGPDIFMIHNSWLPVFLKAGLVAEAPTGFMSLEEYKKTFYPVVAENFTSNGKIYGVPRGIDGLVLFYNEQILKDAGVEPPQTWDQFRDGAINATVVDPEGKIVKAGAAIGTAGNVDHWQDILGLLFFEQPGASLETPNTKEGGDILKFYTDFVVDPKQRVWDRTWESSTQAFAAGKVAFYFAPSWRAHELRQINPSLQFKMISVPQLPGKKVGYASYWGYVVSSKSQFKDEAFEFLKYLSSGESEKLLYQEAAKVRLFGIPYSRVDLAQELTNDPFSGSVVTQGPYFKSWYLVSSTRDQGINDAMSKYYEDAVNAVVGGSDPGQALEIAAKGVKQVLGEFVNVSAPAASGQ